MAEGSELQWGRRNIPGKEAAHMKGLYRKLAAIYLVSAAMFILIFSVSLYIAGRSENEHYLSQLLENVESNYIRSSGENGNPDSGLEDAERKIESILKQATTEYATSIFAVGKEDGKILGMTENNQQEINIRNVDEGTELLDYLEILPKDEAVLLYINGKYQNAVVRELDNIYLTAFSDLDRVTDNVKLTFWTGVSGMAAISLLTVLLIRHHLRKYLFGHFIKIKEGIYSILRGEKDMYEDDSEIPELKPLVEMIFKLEQEYIEKSRGMDRMEDQLNEARSEAEYDRLTGLYNRTGFERRAEAFLGEENRKGAMVLFDLDNFKRVNDSEGHPIQNALVDRDGDGAITQADRYMTGKSPNPDFFYGINLKLSYKNWDFGFNGHGSAGNWAFNDFASANSTSNVDVNAGNLPNFAQVVTKTGFTAANSGEQWYSDMFLENASFFRMDDINLGYTFRHVGAWESDIRLAFSVQNVFVLTGYSGVDPEIPGVNGIDGSIWPRPRTYSLRLNINF